MYHTLAQSRSANIKQTLAYSLHEVARLLGEGALVEAELVPVFEDMIQDQEAVQMGVIKHLALFLEMLPEPCRVSYLPLLHDILHSTNPFNWRLRQYLAVQLPALVELPPRNELFRTVFPLVMILLQDPVASVRRDSFRGVTVLLNSLYQLTRIPPDTVESANLAAHSTQHLDEMARAINSLVAGEKYQLRQLWVEVCHELLRNLPRDLFEHYFVQGILTLTCDRVSNVRVAVAFFLVDWGSGNLPPWKSANCSSDDSAGVSDLEIESSTVLQETPWHWLLRRSDIRECVIRLARDDNDVYLNLVQLQPLFPDVVFSSMSCRGLKSPPGGLVPVALSPLEGTVSEDIARLSVSGDAFESDNGLEYLEDSSAVGGTSASGAYTSSVVADVHAATSGRGSFSSSSSNGSSGDEESAHHHHPRLGAHCPLDLAAIDIDLVPRGRAASLPALEYLQEGADPALIEMNEELDIIDGIIRASPSKKIPEDIEHALEGVSSTTTGLDTFDISGSIRDADPPAKEQVDEDESGN